MSVGIWVFKNIRVQESGLAGEGWQTTVSGGFLPNHRIQQTKPHIVTITMPDSTVFKFETIFYAAMSV